MTSDDQPKPSKSPPNFLKAEIILFISGILLYLVAEPLSWKSMGEGMSRQVPERMEKIEHVGDKLAWLGIGLVLVGALGQTLGQKEG